MIDAHVHLEKGPYNKEWLEEFVQAAQKKNISELHMVEHTHIFKEFNSLYDEMSEYNDYQQGMPLGMNSKMLRAMKYSEVNILTASDAHLPKDVGAYVQEMADIIKA